VARSRLEVADTRGLKHKGFRQMTYLETRLKQVEKELKINDKPDKKCHIIHKKFDETTKEARLKYEQENGVKIQDGDDLIIISLVETREQAEQLKKDKEI
jgi:uncharacterized Zn ribbon protein